MGTQHTLYSQGGQLRHVPEGVIGQHANAVVAQVTRRRKTEGHTLLLVAPEGHSQRSHMPACLPSIHPPTQPPTIHPSTHPSIHPLTIHTPTCSPTYLSSKCSSFSLKIYSVIEAIVHSFVHSFSCSVIPLEVCSFTSLSQQSITPKSLLILCHPSLPQSLFLYSLPFLWHSLILFYYIIS